MVDGGYSKIQQNPCRRARQPYRWTTNFVHFIRFVMGARCYYFFFYITTDGRRVFSILTGFRGHGSYNRNVPNSAWTEWSNSWWSWRNKPHGVHRKLNLDILSSKDRNTADMLRTTWWKVNDCKKKKKRFWVNFS